MQIVLGSRSPRRLQLLQQLIPDERIEVLPPRSIQEPGFEDLQQWTAIQDRLSSIAGDKCDDVLSQIEARKQFDPATELSVVISADTVIVASEDDGRRVVLGQPPLNDSWGTVVRHWFTEYFAGRAHSALTALCVQKPGRPRCEHVVKSEITFRADVERWLDWYIATGESLGKAGGYALQGAGSVFVEHVQGSLSNVIGLPIETLLETFQELDIDVEAEARADRTSPI